MHTHSHVVNDGCGGAHTGVANCSMQVGGTGCPCPLLCGLWSSHITSLHVLSLSLARPHNRARPPFLEEVSKQQNTCVRSQYSDKELLFSVQLMDMLVEQTHDLRYEWRNNERPLRFTDTRVDEQSRGISLKSTPMSLILEGSNGKSFLMNMVDTPGDQPAALLQRCFSLGLVRVMWRNGMLQRQRVASHQAATLP